LALIAYLVWIRCDARYEAEVKEALQLHAVEETKRIIAIYVSNPEAVFITSGNGKFSSGS
jgi:hypothetical protein